jgi:hypothetical protein
MIIAHGTWGDAIGAGGEATPKEAAAMLHTPHGDCTPCVRTTSTAAEHRTRELLAGFEYAFLYDHVHPIEHTDLPRADGSAWYSRSSSVHVPHNLASLPPRSSCPDTLLHHWRPAVLCRVAHMPRSRRGPVVVVARHMCSDPLLCAIFTIEMVNLVF